MNWAELVRALGRLVGMVSAAAAAAYLANLSLSAGVAVVIMILGTVLATICVPDT